MSPNKTCRNGTNCQNKNCRFLHMDTGTNISLSVASSDTHASPRNHSAAAAAAANSNPERNTSAAAASNNNNNNNNRERSATPNSNMENLDPAAAAMTKSVPNKQQQQQKPKTQQRRQKPQQKQAQKQPQPQQQDQTKDGNHEEQDTTTNMSQESFQGTTATETTKKTKNIKRRKPPPKKKTESASSVTSSSKQQQQPNHTQESMELPPPSREEQQHATPSHEHEEQQEPSVPTTSNKIAQQKKKKKSTPCRYGPKCKHQPNCLFFHSTPPPDQTPITVGISPFSNELQKTVALSEARATSSRRKNDKVPIEEALLKPPKENEETSVPPLLRKKKTPCRDGTKCRNISKCPFVHQPLCQDVAQTDTNSQPVAALGESLNDKKNPRNTKKMCKFGRKCHDHMCSFDHPKNPGEKKMVSKDPTDTQTAQEEGQEISNHNTKNDKSDHHKQTKKSPQKPRRNNMGRSSNTRNQEVVVIEDVNDETTQTLHQTYLVHDDTPPSLEQPSLDDSRHAQAEEEGWSEEERELYKAQRKAAKKERRRLEREAKSGTTDDTNDDIPSNCATFSQDDNDDDSESATNGKDESEEGETTSEKQDSNGQSNAGPRVSRKEQKQARYERLRQDLERQNKERADAWTEATAKEEHIMSIILEFLLAEFVRANKADDLDRKTLRPHVQERLKPICSQAYYDLFPVVTRVMVRGMPKKQNDLNDRPGTIRYWDSSKGMFFVGLDTKKKGKNASGLFFLPENLEAVTTKDASQKSRGWHSDPVFVAKVNRLYSSYNLEVDLYQSEMKSLVKAAEQEDVDVVLDRIMKARTDQEIRQKEEEEYFKKQEAEARRRREEKMRKEQEEHEKRRRMYEEFKQDYETKRKQQRAQAQQQQFVGGGFGQHGPRCGCFRCQHERAFQDFFFAHGVRFNFGFSHYDDDDDDYDDYDDYDDDEWDRRYEQMEDGNREQQLQEAAKTLGVDVDASESDIKRVYRRKALLYHPDRFRAEDHTDGTTKEDAEEHIRDLNNAYDILLSKFDS